MMLSNASLRTTLRMVTNFCLSNLTLINFIFYGMIFVKYSPPGFFSNVGSLVMRGSFWFIWGLGFLTTSLTLAAGIIVMRSPALLRIAKAVIVKLSAKKPSISEEKCIDDFDENISDDSDDDDDESNSSSSSSSNSSSSSSSSIEIIKK